MPSAAHRKAALKALCVQWDTPCKEKEKYLDPESAVFKELVLKLDLEAA